MNRAGLDLCDFHSHILPGADHGSRSVDDTVFQLRSAEKCGVTRIVATPHFYPNKDRVESFINRRTRAFNHLKSVKWDGAPEIRLGAEVLICENFDRIPGLDKLCISGSRTLLLELPFSDFSQEYVCVADRLIKSGYKVLLAHADRYKQEYIEGMMHTGCLIQLNASGIVNQFAPKVLFDWMKQGRVVALGSDIHGKDSKAYKNFVKAVKKSSKYIDFIKEASDKLWNEFN